MRPLAAVAFVAVFAITSGCGLLDRGGSDGESEAAAWTTGASDAGNAEPTGDGGPIMVGMHYDEVVALHPDFPAQSEGVPNDAGGYGFVWREGEYLFDREGYVTSMGHYVGGKEATSSASAPGGGGSSQPAGAAAVPAWVSELPGVEVEVLRPVSADGTVQSGWQVESGSGRCESSAGSRPSSSAVEAGTVQCSTTTAMSASDCWPDETRRAALCLRDATEPVLVRISSPGTLTGQPANSTPVPAVVTLEDGASCSFMSGGAQSSFTDGGVFYTSRGACSGSGRTILLTSEGRDSASGIYAADGKAVIDVTSDFETARQVRVTSVSFLGTA